MKASSVSLVLGLAALLFELTVSAVFLSVSPNRQQFLRRDAVSLSCVDDGQTVDGWAVKRTTGGQTQTCDGGQQDFGGFNGSSCIIPHLFSSDSGVYWCETRAAQRSVQVNISVSGHSVLLEFPKLPVIAGSDVTLRCKTRESSSQLVYFFSNRSFIGFGLAGEFTISDVQRSDEGLYWCSTGLFSKSSKTWMSVVDPPPLHLSVVGLICPLVVFCLYCMSTILMVSIYCSRKRGNEPGVETEHGVEGGQRVAEELGYVTEHDF
ncbi:low affinity immunoglobulin gamma Fc region receptor II-like [Anarrhichthys ocellatus]|uniref:low affinity immunoglobulin gamma Fc region receptor II-like n=1 Tax=Anarrhichthys ocellatus TaxID=433405 RepID=UPI0012EDAC06|nr:low affinity immunoglobulin gamma Fc region receptor II-like [Anarrhichthys ocellatus]